jgi:hypothetical protein
MSKTDDSKPVESQTSQLYKDLKRAEKEKRLWKNKYQAEVSGKKQVDSAANQVVAPQNQGQISPEPVKSTKEHTWKPWQAVCVECGEKNPEFKPETKCANCGTMTGAVEVAKKMDYCPECGTRLKFTAASKEGKQKIEEMFPERGMLK